MALFSLHFTNFRFPLLQLPSKRTKNAGFLLFFLAMSLLFAENVVCGLSSKNEIPLYHHRSRHTPFTHYTGSIAAAAVEVTCGKAATNFTSFLPPMHLLSPCSTYYYYCTVHPLHVTGCWVGRRWRQQQLFLEPAWAKSRPGW